MSKKDLGIRTGPPQPLTQGSDPGGLPPPALNKTKDGAYEGLKERGLPTGNEAPPTQVADVGGVKILMDGQRLDMGQLESAQLGLEIEFAKEGGTAMVPATYGDAKLKVPPGTTAKVDVVLGWQDGQQRITAASLRFENAAGKPITIKNPVKALKPQAAPKLLRPIADWFADMNITGARIDEQGIVHLGGNVEKGIPGILSAKSDLDEETKGTFPDLNLDVQSIQSGAVIAKAPAPDPKAPPANEIGLNALLKSLSGITKEARYSLDLKSSSGVLSADTESAHVEMGKAPIDVHIEGTGVLDKDGNLAIRIRSEGSKLDTGGLDAVPEGALKLYSKELRLEGDVGVSARTDVLRGIIHNPKSGVKVPFLARKDGLVVAKGKLDMSFKDMKASLINNTRLKDGTARWNLRIDATEPVTIEGVDGNLRLNKAFISTQGDTLFRLDGPSFTTSQGIFDVKVKGEDVLLNAGGIGVKVPGGANVLLQSNPAAFDGKNLGGKGSLTYEIGLEEGKHLLERKVDYDLTAQGLRLTPKGTDFALPLNLAGNVEAVRAVANAPKVGELGSPELMNRILEITKGEAKIREGNQVELLVDGQESRPKRMEIIGKAEKSIYMQTLIWKDDESGIAMAQALVDKKKANPDLDVRVVVDALGNLEELNDLTIEGRKVYKMMKDAGIELELYNNVGASALLELKSILDGNDKLPDLSHMAELSDPSQALSLVTELVKAAKGQTAGVDVATQAKIGTALSKLMEAINGEGAVLDLASINADGIIDLKELETLAGAVANLNHRWHEKYTIVDGKYVVMGGLNVADEYLKDRNQTYQAGDKTKPTWRDTDIFIHGPAALDVAKSAQDNWKTVTGIDKPLAGVDEASIGTPGTSTMQIIQHRPFVDGDHHVTMALIESIKTLGAGDQAYIPNAYFLTTGALEPLKQVLADAAKRGVDVRVVTNSADTTDLPQINYAAIPQYRDLLEAGVRIFERAGAQTMHTKAFYLGKKDGSHSMVGVGSWNMDNRSAALNGEGLALVHNDQKLAKRARAQFLTDMGPEVATEVLLPKIAYLDPQTEVRNSVTSILANLL